MTQSACADRDLLCIAVQEAAAVALRFWRSDPESWDKGGRQGPVSEADLAVDRFLHRSLLQARPDYGWLSEESFCDHARIEKTHVFIIDPIDGTRHFLDGDVDFSICAAVSVDGTLTAAAIGVPALGRVYIAAKDCGASMNGIALRVSDSQELEEANGLVSSRELSGGYWKTRPNSRPNQIGPISTRFCELASGQFDCLISLQATNEWDAAAGELIASEAGAVVTDANGLPNCYNKEDPRLMGYLAANPVLHRRLLELSIVT